MTPGKPLERNVRPRIAEYDDEVDDESEISGEEDLLSGHDEEDGSVDGESESLDEGRSQDEGDDVSEDEEGDARVTDRLKNVSFGALKQAQDSISRKRKRGSNDTPDQESKLEVLRERLRMIRSDRERQEKTHKASKRGSRSTGQSGGGSHRARDAEADSADSDSDSAPSEHLAATHARSSKHAPMSQTSKRQVTRRRQVVEVPKRQIRDPRFDALPPGHDNAHNSEKAYAFLREYQQSEIAELQAALKLAKTDDDRTKLRRRLVSMQNTLKTKDAKEREREVVRRHRKAEREAVQQGKTPYFLKQKEIKEQALVEKFKGMKAREREKVIEKKRLKESQREKRRMPVVRRRAG